MKNLKPGDKIIHNDHGRTLFQKGHTYTFLKYHGEYSGCLQVKECIIASPGHNMPVDDYEKFTWLKYIIYNIQTLIRIKKDRWYYDITCRTVSDYCRWKPFTKNVSDKSIAEYYEDLAKLDKY